MPQSAQPEAQQTLFLHVCSGASLPGCQRVYSKTWEKWSGSETETSHGSCDQCSAIELAYIDSPSELRGHCSNCERACLKKHEGEEESLCNFCERFEIPVDVVGETFTSRKERQFRSTELRPLVNERPFGSGTYEIPSEKIVQRIQRSREPLLPPIHNPVPLFKFGACAGLILILLIAGEVSDFWF